MKVTLKGTKNMFPWYAASKYSAARNLQAYAWWNLLAYRRALLRSEGEKLAVGFRAIKQDPLASRLFPQLELSVKDTTFIEWSAISRIHDAPEISKRVDRWLSKYGEIPLEAYPMHVYFTRAPRLSSLHELSVRYLSKRRGDPDEIAHIAMQLTETAHVSVDLTQPDSELKAAFDAWLASKRTLMDGAGCSIEPRPLARKKGAVKRFNDIDFARWADTRVLDYLDIQIACRAEGRDMPSDPDMACLLLETYTPRKVAPRKVASKSTTTTSLDHTEVFKKQTKKHAHMLITPRVLNLLSRQGVADLLKERLATLLPSRGHGTNS